MTRSAGFVRPVVVIAVAGAVMVLMGSGCRSSSEADERALAAGEDFPHVVFIMVDTLRTDVLGCYGNPDGHSPTIDALADEGVLFERCLAASPWTLPSVASLFTGVYPGVHKATSYSQMSAMERDLRPEVSVLSDEGFTTLAEVFRESGFQTAAFSANPFVQDGYGFGQGFQHFEGDFAAVTVRGEIVTDAGMKWLADRNLKYPHFLYLHYMDVHGPYNAAPRYMNPLVERVAQAADKQPLRPEQLQTLNAYLNKPPSWATDESRYERLRKYREYWIARYAAGVREFDDYLAELIDQLKERGVWDNALVILTSDHGEAFCEHGYWDHGYTQHDYELHVPLIIRWPDRVPAGRRVSGIVRLIDIMPTLAALLGLESPAAIQGESFAKTLRPQGPVSVERPAFAEALKGNERGREQQTYYEWPWKLIFQTILKPIPGRPGLARPENTQVLYNLETDPLESRDVSSQKIGIALDLLEKLRAQLKDNDLLRPNVQRSGVAVDERQQEAMKSLGYAGDDE